MAGLTQRAPTTNPPRGDASGRLVYGLGSCLILAAVGALTYANSLEGPFFLDDIPAIARNDAVHSLWPPWGALWPPEHTALAGRPLVSLSFAVNHALGGLAVGGYHAVNIALHLLNSLLLFGVVRRTLRRSAADSRLRTAVDGLSLAAALVWVVHPLQTESVNYITQRTGLMMAFCYLFTLYGAMRALESEHPGRWLVACVVSCATGMACKEAMVSAPIAVFLYYWAFGTESVSRTLSRHRVFWAALAATWLPLAALIASGPRADTIGFGLGVGALDYAMNQCGVILDYLRLALWPHPLSIYYGPPRSLAPSEVLPQALALLVLLVATAVALWRRPGIGFPAVCFFLILTPTSSFVPIVTEVGAERRMYLPLAGLTVLVATGGFTLLDRGARRIWNDDGPRAARIARWSGIALVAIVVALLSTATIRRNRDYRSVMTLWQSAVEAMPDNPHSHVNLGNEFLIRGELQDAERHYRAALELDPDDTLAHYNLGQVFHARGRLEPAIRFYARAAELAPDFARAHYSLSRALLEAGYPDEAIASLREVVRLRPDFAPAREELALLLARSPGATAPRD